MSKRSRNGDDIRPTKRLKPDQPTKPPVTEEIQFARQLQQLLAFRQDGISQLRTGIASFKVFLESILYHKNEDDRGRELSILREYLEGEKPAELIANDSEQERPFLAQLWQAWSFASTSNNDQLCSSIAATLALLLKTLSSLLDFRDIGVQLCRTVLQPQHLRLVKRSLDAPRHKDFLVSPCLRLLIEVSGFDGGVLAKKVYKRREQTFDAVTLRRLLGGVKSGITDEEAKRRPAIRTLTMRYILTHLRHLHAGGKADLLKNRPLCTSLFHFLRDDPADLLVELLSTTEQHVLKDEELSRSAKAALLVDHNLERVTEIATRSAAEHAAAERASNWLKDICTKPSYGILRASGWYPPGTSKVDRETRSDQMIDLGLDSIDFYDRNDKPNVRNATLSSWLQTLRPHSSLQERELLITCFTSAPELVAAYFAEKHMSLEPKLSNTWIAYASFLFEVVQLPVPAYFGHEDGWAEIPPQTHIMLDSILPRPLTQKVLNRCLNQSSELITFFAIRVLILALDKLDKVQAQLAAGTKASEGNTVLWLESSKRLLSGFVDRCPPMKDIISTFRKLADDEEHALQHEAIARLLRLYYEVLPVEAMEEQFDISAALTAVLVKSQADDSKTDLQQLTSLRLQHLLQVARYSPGMRWFSKQAGLEFSTIVTLLRLHAGDVQNKQIRDLIFHVLKENHVIGSESELEALVAVLHHGTRWNASTGSFLDDCFSRATRKPVKYLDDLDAIRRRLSAHGGEGTDQHHISNILVAVFVEQAPYVVNKPNLEKIEIMAFINSYFQLLLETDDRSDLLTIARNDISAIEGFQGGKNYHDPAAVLNTIRIAVTTDSFSGKPEAFVSDESASLFPDPPIESENHPELLKWAKKDLDLALEDGDISSLILCLSSRYPEIRSQALVQLHKLLDKMFAANLENKDPIYVLIGELVETYQLHRQRGADALPYIVSCFTTHALRVQMQPAHFIYPKINEYLNKGPEWRISKLPMYWIQHTVLGEPDEDDAYWKEVLWVLEWLVDGLRTLADMEILRKGGILERVMSLHASPGAGPKVKERVLEILWRTASVEGGSTTLITRTGVLSWLDSVRARGNGGIEMKLREKVLETCDRAKIEEWSGMALESL